MNHRLSMSPALLLGLGALLLPTIDAAQFAISGDINGGLDPGTSTGTTPGVPASSTWSGTNPALGFVGNGGYDAFDGYGYLRNLGNLTVTRQVDALFAQSTYRWLDIFTNPTAATITRTVQFYGDLGSDNRTRIETNQPGLLVTSDNNSGVNGDPVVAHVGASIANFGASSVGNARIVNENSWGNYADDYVIDYNLSLAPGETVGILHFSSLIRNTTRDFAGDLALANTTGTTVLNNPILTGLTYNQISTIKNFATPEPTTWALLIMGISGLWWWRRRQSQPSYSVAKLH